MKLLISIIFAIQTFLVQHAGSGTYLPTERSIAGGAYGAVPASTLIGPKGGRELVEETLKLINSLWHLYPRRLVLTGFCE